MSPSPVWAPPEERGYPTAREGGVGTPVAYAVLECQGSVGVRALRAVTPALGQPPSSARRSVFPPAELIPRMAVPTKLGKEGRPGGGGHPQAPAVVLGWGEQERCARTWS